MAIQNPKSKIQNRRADLLLEVGTEEIPAAYLDGAIAQLGREAARLLEDAHLPAGSIATFGTPRRLVLIARGVSAVQYTPPEEIRGPSKPAAYNAAGKPTGALIGFVKARGGQLSQVKVVPTDKGEYVYLLKPARQSPAAAVLPQVLGELISRLRFPKTMRWEAGGFRFARPVRWLVALYGHTPLAVAVGTVTSGPTTWLGGPKKPKAVAVSGVASYLAALKRAGVLLDQRQRKARIEQLVRAAAKQVRGVPAPEAFAYGLLDEVANLVEQPVVMTGAFDPTYLTLPREVLLASMAKHQRVFAVQAGRKLSPKFVAILEGKPRNLERVRQMFEHILNARLADSLLFWEQDQAQGIEAMAARASGITLHEQLGSMQEKSTRLSHMAESLAEVWKLNPSERAQLDRACRLAKADLASTMVKEFPTLQGVMGKYYARASGAASEVAEAIEEHYLPLGDKRPTTRLGSALSLLDKFDTLASYFCVGIKPSGDQDPFGLRRAAQGIVEVAWAVQRPTPFDALFAPWQAAAAMAFAQGRADVAKDVREYVFDRLYTFAWPAPAPSRDLIDAVLTTRPDDVVDAMDRIRSLQRLDSGQALLKAAKVVERTTNILKGAKLTQAAVDPGRFQEPLEHELWRQYDAHKDRISKLIEGRSYAEATSVYGEAFFAPLQEFFSRVMVNVDDAAVQQNRLALMRAINVLYTVPVADLSKLAILQSSRPSVSQSLPMR